MRRLTGPVNRDLEEHIRHDQRTQLMRRLLKLAIASLALVGTVGIASGTAHAKVGCYYDPVRDRTVCTKG
ncbi:MAG: hypothetical protein JWN46_3395 [Acidimicrobiales bacterium]|nr:hypothetical protein [Acidimicrobiales bacterium]